MDAEYLQKYFQNALTNLKRHFDKSDFDEKEKLKIRIELLNEMNENISWQINTPEQKQSLRIQNLASMRKSQALPNFIEKQEKGIKFYELVTNCFPFILALDSYSSQKQLLSFCIIYSDKIDFAGSSFKGELPNIKEIEISFKSYYESVSIYKNTLFEECYNKIDKLYKDLKTIGC